MTGLLSWERRLKPIEALGFHRLPDFPDGKSGYNAFGKTARKGCDYGQRGYNMAKLDDRTIANMEVALEKACRRFPNGGDHESRKYVALKLMLSARRGNTTLGGLDVVAHRALEEFSKQKST